MFSSMAKGRSAAALTCSGISAHTRVRGLQRRGVERNAASIAAAPSQDFGGASPGPYEVHSGLGVDRKPARKSIIFVFVRAAA